MLPHLAEHDHYIMSTSSSSESKNKAGTCNHACTRPFTNTKEEANLSVVGKIRQRVERGVDNSCQTLRVNILTVLDARQVVETRSARQNHSQVARMLAEERHDQLQDDS